MKGSQISDIIKKVLDALPKHNLEKIIFKILLGMWIVVIIGLIGITFMLEARNDIEVKMVAAATAVKPYARTRSYIDRYEQILNREKGPEDIKKYSYDIKGDPFSEYKDLVIQKRGKKDHDFALQSINRVKLPLVYKGYIELEEKIIGQINWQNTTRFVEAGSMLDGFKILSVTKERIEAINEGGKKILFELDKPVFGDQLEAILYDRVSQRTYAVKLASEIDDYKVIDIAPNYVILISKGIETRLEL